MSASRLAGLITLAVAWAAPVQAQSITLVPGQSVRVQIDDGGAHFRDDGTATLTPFDQNALEQLRGSTAAGEVGYRSLARSDAPPPEILPDSLHLRFIAVNDRETVLILESGYDGGVVYRARMTVNGRTVATDVCLVQPSKPIYEYWPHGIEKIELTAFELQPWKRGDEVPCA